jgi:hypothetical protein
MFVIASTGRCGTMAICQGLDAFSDHTVWHEPEPRLLQEAYLKHRGRDFHSDALAWVLNFFRQRADEPYGQSFRAPNLLSDVRRAVPDARFLVVVRPPLEYVASATSMLAFRRGDEWDRTRIVPEDSYPRLGKAPLTQKLAWHWTAVNDLLLEFAESTETPVVILHDLERQLPLWADALGVRVLDHAGLSGFLASKPNGAPECRPPEGCDADQVLETAGPTWEIARQLSRAPQPSAR